MAVVNELAVPTARDLELLPDGSLLEVIHPASPASVYLWRARTARVPFVRFWEGRRTGDPEPGARITTTSAVLAATLWGWVLEYGDAAVPLVTLPEVAHLSCSECGSPFVRDGIRARWNCQGCGGYLTDADVAHLRRGGQR